MTQSGRQPTLQRILAHSTGSCSKQAIAKVGSPTIASRLGLLRLRERTQSTDSWKRVASQRLRERACALEHPAEPGRRPLRARLDGGKQMRIPPNQVLYFRTTAMGRVRLPAGALARRDQDIALAYGWR